MPNACDPGVLSNACGPRQLWRVLLASRRLATLVPAMRWAWLTVCREQCNLPTAARTGTAVSGMQLTTVPDPQLSCPWWLPVSQLEDINCVSSVSLRNTHTWLLVKLPSLQVHSGGEHIAHPVMLRHSSLAD